VGARSFPSGWWTAELADTAWLAAPKPVFTHDRIDEDDCIVALCKLMVRSLRTCDFLSRHVASFWVIAARGIRSVVFALGGNMMEASKQETRKLHLLSNPKLRDVFMGPRDDAEPEPPRMIPTSMARSYWAHPSRTGLSAAS
jgi:hypothetical protein